MHCIIDTKKGFTLLEVIVVTMLVSIIGVIASIGYARVAQGMVFTKMNAATIQKGQIAMTKLVREMNNISGVHEGADSSSITFTSIKNGVSGTRTIALSNNTITFNEGVSDDVLTDQVSYFELKYYNYNIDSSTNQGTWLPSSRVIAITLELRGANDVKSKFTARVRPRNIERR